ncbi:MAG: SBBP repeat-containing protein, partial [Chloroflexi bacterium]|nr:SBBP repeat-containing protein [Chloroflexota bacterium]
MTSSGPTPQFNLQLKYEFIVQPGADPSQIRLAYRGATNVLVNPENQLEVQTPAGNFHDEAPYAYQEINGQQTAVSVAYTLGQNSTYGFHLGTYDPSRPLVLDPAVLIYAGFIGGSGSDYDRSIAVDSAGNVYVTGYTTSNEATFPEAVGPDLTYNGGTDDAFVAKVRADGTGLVYAGYIGGSGSDDGRDIAVDSAGN